MNEKTNKPDTPLDHAEVIANAVISDNAVKHQIDLLDRFWKLFKLASVPLAIGGVIAVLLLQNIQLNDKLDRSANVIAAQRTTIEKQAGASCAQGIFISEIIQSSLQNPNATQTPNPQAVAAAQKELATLNATLAKDCHG